jgi:hypothetical protein
MPETDATGMAAIQAFHLARPVHDNDLLQK